MDIVINRQKLNGKTFWYIKLDHVSLPNEVRSFPEKRSVVNYLRRTVFFNKTYDEISKFLYSIYPYGRFGKNTIRIKETDIFLLKIIQPSYIFI